MEDSVAYLRRPIDQMTFNEIKECQIHLSRFEAAVCFGISLVTVRYVFKTNNYEQFLRFKRRLVIKTKQDAEKKLLHYKVLSMKSMGMKGKEIAEELNITPAIIYKLIHLS